MSGALSLATVQNSKCLRIDFKALLGFPSSLDIAFWQDGIDWVLKVEEEEPEYRSYLEEAPLPINLIFADPRYEDWITAIPQDIRHSILRYPEMGFTLLFHINHYQSAHDLYRDNPNLLWFLLFTARLKKWPEQKVLTLLSGKRRAILAACGQPSCDAAVRLLKKLTFEVYAEKEYDFIKRAFALPKYAQLNHYANINLKLLSTLIGYPELIGSALVKNLPPDVWPAEIFQLIDDIKRMFMGVNDPNGIDQPLRNIKSYEALRLFHDRLVVKLNRNRVDHLKVGNFPEPPLQGTKDIVPITGSKMLALEGISQSHCVRSYESRILEGTYYVYQVLSPERASLGVILKNNRPVLDQLYLSHNRPVSDSTRLKVLEWLNDKNNEI